MSGRERRKKEILTALHHKPPTALRDLLAQVSGTRVEIAQSLEELCRANLVTSALHAGRTAYKLSLAGEQKMREPEEAAD
jgi:hypothetical protein